MKARNWFWVLIGCIIFGFLMGLRSQFHELWLQILVAVTAGAVFALTLIWARHRSL